MNTYTIKHVCGVAFYIQVESVSRVCFDPWWTSYSQPVRPELAARLLG